jgi:hypothetical protein
MQRWLRLAGSSVLGAIALGMAGVALLFALVMVWRLNEHRLSARSGDWIAVPATLLERQIVTSGSDGHQLETLRYRYTVGDRTYVSGRGSFPDGDDFGWSGARPVMPLIEATAITCYVSPSDPGSATLERGPTPLGTLVWVLAVLALIAALGAHMVWRWSRRLLSPS